jgi:hypothetical protein
MAEGLSLRELFVAIGLDIDEGAFAKVEGAIEHLKEGLFALGTIAAAGAAAFGLYELGKGTAEAGEEIFRASQRLGISTDAVQEFRHAAIIAGVPVEALEMAMTRLSAAAGTSLLRPFDDAAVMFSRFGIHVRDSNGHLKTGDELLEAVAGRFETLSDAEKPAALRALGFGRAGAQLLPFLNKGAAGIKELREEAHRMGVVLNADAITAAKKFTLAHRELSEKLRGFKNRVGVPILNALNSIHDSLEKFFEQFSGAQIEQAIRAVAYAIGFLLLPTLIEMAVATIVAAIPVVALALAFVALALAIDDVNTYIEGGDSLLGRAIAKWETFAGVIEMVKLGIDAVRFAYLALDTYLSGGTKFDFLKKFFAGAVSNTAKEEYADATYKATLANMNFGAGAAPAVTGGRNYVHAPQFQVQIDVDASGNASPKEVATETRTQIQEWWNGTLRDADGSTPGYGVLRQSP